MISLVSLGDVVEINPRPPRNDLGGENRSAAFLPMAAVSEDGSFREETRPVGEMLKGYTYFERGDVLLAKITPCMENGKATHVRELSSPFGFGSTEFHVLRPSSQIDGRYLFFLVWNNLFRKAAERNMTGTAGQKRVPASFLQDWKIPLPALSEQRRLALMLDKADAIRRKRQEAIALTEQLLRSTFLGMFGDLDRHGWEITTVAALAEGRSGSIRTGPFGSQLLHSEFVDSGIAVLGIDNAVANEFRWGKPRFITEEKYASLRRYTVNPGDVIITIMGTCGRCAVIPEDIPPAINTKHLCCITLDRSKCLPEFLHSYFLYHPSVRSYLEQTAKGAIMEGLNMGIISQLPVPVVPMSLQRRYQAFTQVLARTRKRLLEQAQTAEALFNSLVHRAFTAQL